MTLSKRSFFALGLALVAFGLTACGSATKAALKPEASRRHAPNFTLKDASGQTVQLSDYKGKVVFLNFWATWCGPCKEEIPWLIEFEQQYKGKGFAVLGVSMDEEGWDIVRPYMANAKVNYRMLLGTDSMAQLYGGVDALPTSFILDREGRIAATYVGAQSKRKFQNDLYELLGSQANASLRVFPALVLGSD
jgi:cytochrome c biogenesis protein CcmG/thiol:disulfide interchange protein DsbE